MPDSTLDKNIFSEKLATWYNQHKRDLPWRHTKNPYKIWLSEIILQQTRVKQGLPYYEKFVEAYPTVSDLANAPEQEVLRHWQGLGYYSRARNMHVAAQTIATELAGEFPQSYKELLKLKGVGEYTAAAIASFAFKEAVAVVDGNVFRVLARLFNIDEDIASPKGKKIFTELANQLISEKIPDTHNQAIMEFGALHCTPQKPNCMFCPFQQECVSFRLGRQQDLPVKIKKVKVKKRFFNYLAWERDGKTLTKERQKGDIWQGLHDFHLIESDKQLLDWEQVLDHLADDGIVAKAKLISQSEDYKHILTHQRISARFFKIEAQSEEIFIELMEKFELKPQTDTQIQEIPKPILIKNYLDGQP